DSRDGLEARRVLERDRAPQLVRRGTGDDRQRDLGADALDGKEQREELTLGRVGKAEELQDVLAHVKVGLEHDFSPGLRLPAGVGGSLSPRIAITIRCTCAFSARPDPQTVCFTRAGAYSAHSTPASAAATMTAPRAWPTESAVRASAPTNDSSSATASGANSAM